MNIYSAKKEREKYLREKQNDREKQIYNKPLNNYQQFIKYNQERIKEEFPELSYTERFSKLAAMWKLEKKIKEDFPELLRKKELKDAKLFAPELFEKFPNRSEKYLEIYMSNSYLNNSRQKVIDNFLKQFNDLIKFLQNVVEHALCVCGEDLHMILLFHPNLLRWSQMKCSRCLENQICMH